jgi:DNA-binding NarL/FixJ family response regulator
MGGGLDTSGIRVVVADDHPVIRAGLRHILERQDGIEVVGEASDGPTVLEAVRSSTPDVVVMDVSMPRMNGIDAVRALRRERGSPRVVMLSVHYSEAVVLEAMEAGAVGYVLKEAAREELTAAVRAAGQGHGYLSPPVARMIAARLTTKNPAASRLTSRERQVVQLLTEGVSVREAAARLFVSTATVKSHRSNAMRKIGARSITDLVRYAIREGLIAG